MSDKAILAFILKNGHTYTHTKGDWNQRAGKAAVSKMLATKMWGPESYAKLTS